MYQNQLRFFSVVEISIKHSSLYNKIIFQTDKEAGKEERKRGWVYLDHKSHYYIFHHFIGLMYHHQRKLENEEVRVEILESGGKVR